MQRTTKSINTGEIDTQEALAALIRNTRTTARALSLIEVEHWLEIAISRIGSLSEVADLISLSSKMLRQFQCVGRLSPSVQHLFRTRRIDSVDAALYLSKMPASKQLPIAKELAANTINTSDLRVIADMLARNPKMGASAAIENVKATRNIVHHVAEFVIRGSKVDTSVLRKRFDDVLGKQNVVSVDEKDGIGRTVLTTSGKRILMQMCRKNSMTKARAITAIAEGEEIS